MTEDMIQAQKEIAKSPQTGGARFTEIMDGYLYVGDDIEDFEIARDAAKGASSTARFYLSVDAWDINTLINKDNHAAMLTGTFSCGALSKDPFMILRGDFQLFSRDPRTPDTDNLVYNFDMLSVTPFFIAANFRRPVRSFISMDTKSWIRQLPSAFPKHGQPQRHSISNSLVPINPSSDAGFSPSVSEISSMNFSRFEEMVKRTGKRHVAHGNSFPISPRKSQQISSCLSMHLNILIHP
jgi:hypothetical protein